MKVEFPAIPSLTPQGLLNGWLGTAIVNDHEFQVHVAHQPDNYSSHAVSWTGWKQDETSKCWTTPPANASSDCWDQKHDSSHRWLSGGAKGTSWETALEQAAKDFANKLMPEPVERVEYNWEPNPEIKRGNANGSQTT